MSSHVATYVAPSRICLAPTGSGMLAVMTVGERIRQARKAAGRTQRQLGEAVDTDSITISRYERGDIKDPGSGVLRAIADELGVSVEWLMTGREQGPPTERRAAPAPQGWEDFRARRPDLIAKFPEDELAEIRDFAARYHRARTASDYEAVFLRVLDARPVEEYAAKKRSRKRG